MAEGYWPVPQAAVTAVDANWKRCVMPLTKKGKKIKKSMTESYGKKRGESVFYAMENSGKLKGVAKKKKRTRKS